MSPIPSPTSSPTRLASIAALATLAAGLVLATPVRAQDKLLEEAVGFTGELLFLQTRVPALVIGVVRDGKTAVFGFGETSDGSGKAPDRNTMMRIGSISKVFTGQVMASLAAGGTIKFTDR